LHADEIESEIKRVVRHPDHRECDEVTAGEPPFDAGQGGGREHHRAGKQQARGDDQERRTVGKGQL
jgi:hypothetical protein